MEARRGKVPQQRDWYTTAIPEAGQAQTNDLGATGGGQTLADMRHRSGLSTLALRVMPLTANQIKSTFGELHFFFDGGDGYKRGSDRPWDPAFHESLFALWASGKQIGASWVSV